jgi:hypothetical protein
MGRPINKRFFGSGAGNQIKVRAKIGANAEGDGFIVRQRGTRRFRVTVGADTGVCTLVNKNTGSLAANEMIINVLNDAGERVQVTKLFNRVAIVEGNQKIRWTFDPSLTDGAVQVKDVEGPTLVILTQPQSITVDAGDTATFSVSVTGVAAADISYQWQKAESTDLASWSNIGGATNASFTTGATAFPADNGDGYRVIITAAAAANSPLTSAAAILTVVED